MSICMYVYVCMSVCIYIYIYIYAVTFIPMPVLARVCRTFSWSRWVQREVCITCWLQGHGRECHSSGQVPVQRRHPVPPVQEGRGAAPRREANMIYYSMIYYITNSYYILWHTIILHYMSYHVVRLCYRIVYYIMYEVQPRGEKRLQRIEEARYNIIYHIICFDLMW